MEKLILFFAAACLELGFELRLFGRIPVFCQGREAEETG